MIPTARRRHVLRALSAAFVIGGALVIAREAQPMIRGGSAAHFPTDDAKAAIAAAFFGATVASINLRWTLRARRAGERASWPLFVDASTTVAILPVLALFAWAWTW